MSADVVMNSPVHQRGMFNIEAFDGMRWRGGMNRRSRVDAIRAAKVWAADTGDRYRVFDPQERVVFDTHPTPMDVLRAAADRLQTSKWDDGRRALAAVAELIAAANAYYTGYAQDEAGEDGPDITGCTLQQHHAAARLQSAIARFGRVS